MIDFNLVPSVAVLPVEHSQPQHQSYDLGADPPPPPKIGADLLSWPTIGQDMPRPPK
jgi:hypothetical protein